MEQRIINILELLGANKNWLLTGDGEMFINNNGGIAVQGGINQSENTKINQTLDIQNYKTPKWVYWVWLVSGLAFVFSLLSILFLNRGDNAFSRIILQN